jgi:outer membrane lipoprotein carrier protein
LFAALAIATAAQVAVVARADAQDLPGAPVTPATPPPAAAPAPTAAPAAQCDAVVAKVQEFYDRSTSFSSDFAQEYWVKQYNVKKQSTGHVTFAKPGKMNWVYATPAGNRVVSDGRTLRVYEEANKQMYEQNVNASQYPAALSFLTGQGKLSDAFDFQLFSGAQMSFPGGMVLVGTPKTATTAYQKVFFYVDQATSQVRRVLVLDGQGNHNRFDFVNPTVNPPVNPGQFVFTPPPGTSIVHP